MDEGGERFFNPYGGRVSPTTRDTTMTTTSTTMGDANDVDDDESSGFQANKKITATA